MPVPPVESDLYVVVTQGPFSDGYTGVIYMRCLLKQLQRKYFLDHSADQQPCDIKVKTVQANNQQDESCQRKGTFNSDHLAHSADSDDSVRDNNGPDQTAQMRSLIWAFVVPICNKGPFLMLKHIQTTNKIY